MYTTYTLIQYNSVPNARIPKQYIEQQYYKMNKQYIHYMIYCFKEQHNV